MAPRARSPERNAGRRGGGCQPGERRGDPDPGPIAQLMAQGERPEPRGQEGEGHGAETPEPHPGAGWALTVELAEDLLRRPLERLGLAGLSSGAPRPANP